MINVNNELAIHNFVGLTMLGDSEDLLPAPNVGEANRAIPHRQNR